MEDKDSFNEFLKDVQDIEAENKKEKVMTSAAQIERLLNRKWQNPYDVLMVGYEATQQEIKKMFRRVILFHLHFVLIFPI